MEFTTADYCVPVISGPSKARLEEAIEAIWRADHPASPSFAEINAAARARGEKPPYRDDDDVTYRCIVLMKAQLKWKLRGYWLNYRLNAQAESITRSGPNYIIEFHHYNKRKRTLLAYDSQQHYGLEPATDYDFHIIYDPDKGAGHVSMLGKSKR